MKNADMPAMPITNDQLASALELGASGASGLTKREYFALKIYCANKTTEPHYEELGYQQMASYEDAIGEADELLKALENDSK